MTEWHNPTARERLEIIRSTSSVAIVGMSADPSRASYFVATYLLSSSCSFDHVWFVSRRAVVAAISRRIYWFRTCRMCAARQCGSSPTALR